MRTAPQKKDDRLFVKDGRRSYRRTYSRTEFRLGLGVVAVLALIAAWFLWKGAHPDPALFAASVGNDVPDTATPAERGPLPPSLAAPGWHERALAWFDPTNLYVKINGREDYYKSFGFQRLGFVSLVHEADTTRIVDVEFFDQGSAANALGAQAGERSPEQTTRVGASGFVNLSSNAMFMTHGRFYVRAIGADTTAATRAQLEHVCRTLAAHLPSEPLPWAYALFAGELGLDPGRVSFMPENAFSFGFTRNVYAARLADDSEIFVVVAPAAAAAKELAQQFEQGFADLSDDTRVAHGVRWARDRYQATFAGVVAEDRWLLGVRGAPDVGSGRASLDRLRAGLRGLPPAVIDQAFATPVSTVSKSSEGVSEAASGAESGKDLPPASEPAYPEER